MNFEITGKLIEKYPTEQKSERFRKREFIVEVVDQNGDRSFTNFIKFQTTNDRCDIIERINVNDNVKVLFNIRGNKYEKDGRVSYFTNLDAWRIETIQAGTASSPSSNNNQNGQSQERPQYNESHAYADSSASAGADDLPF